MWLGETVDFAPSSQHAIGKFPLRGAGHNKQVIKCLVCDNGHHQVVLVLGKSGNQALGVFDARFAEISSSVASPTTYNMSTIEFRVGLAHFLDRIFVEIDHDVVRPGSMQLLHRIPAGISKTADNVVSPEFADSFLHAASPKRICDFDFYQESRHHGKHIDRDRHTEQHHCHVEDPQGGVMGGVHNFSITDSGQRDDGHVECLQER